MGNVANFISKLHVLYTKWRQNSDMLEFHMVSGFP